MENKTIQEIQEGIIDRIIDTYEKAGIPRIKFDTRSEYREEDGEGFTSFKIAFNTQMVNVMKQSIKNILEESGIQEKIDNGEINFNYNFHDMGGNRLGVTELVGYCESKPGIREEIIGVIPTDAEIKAVADGKDARTTFIEEHESIDEIRKRRY